MAHVLVFFDWLALQSTITGVCEQEGYAVTAVSTVEDALMVLRTTLHPLVAIVERDHSSRHPETPLFPTIRQHPDLYGQHRYIAVHAWELSDDERATLRAMGVWIIAMPFSIDTLCEYIAEAVAALP
ncbi:MAG: hypothetical protein PVSMB4_08180 [Ktedonobacterales bacterium]